MAAYMSVMFRVGDEFGIRYMQGGFDFLLQLIDLHVTCTLVILSKCPRKLIELFSRCIRAGAW